MRVCISFPLSGTKGLDYLRDVLDFAHRHGKVDEWMYDDLGETPLHVACKAQMSERAGNVLELLVKRGGGVHPDTPSRPGRGHTGGILAEDVSQQRFEFCLNFVVQL